MKKIFYLSTLALALLTSCLSDIPKEENYGDNRTVSIHFADNGTTRLLGAPQPAAQALFTQGELYFVTTGGMVQRHFTITTGATTANTGGNNINIVELQGTGVQIDGVPGNIRYVYIVGNTEIPPVAIGTNISTVREQLLHIFSQVQRANGDNVVNLWARAQLRDTGTLSANNRPLWVANDNSFDLTAANPHGDGMTLRPTVARIELREFQAIPQNEGGQIASFTIDYIFIDRYFRQAQVSGATNIDHLVSREFAPQNTRAAFFLPTAGDYANDAGRAIHDPVNQTGNAGNNHLVTSGTQRWGYNLFSSGRGTTFSQKPGIVIRLSNVILNDALNTQLPDPQFITIVGFRDATFPDGRPGIQAGNVYQVNTVRFDLEDLSPVPYQNPFDANVTVTLALWNGVNVQIPGFRQPSPLSASIGCNAFHVFNLDAAYCGDCTTGIITYLWEQSPDGVTWLPAIFSTLAEVPVELQNNTSRNFRTYRKMSSAYYRRLATCSCDPTRTLISSVARVSVPEPPASDFPDLYIVINGVRWATRNVDLSSPTGFSYHPADVGMTFQWNRNVGYSTTNPIHRWDGTTMVPAVWNTITPPGTSWYAANDPCPLGWRVPLPADFLSLLEVASTWYEPITGIYSEFGCPPGRVFRYPGAPPIFFPAGATRRSDGTLAPVGAEFWTRTGFSPTQAHSYLTSATLNEVRVRRREDTFFIRCVRID